MKGVCGGGEKIPECFSQKRKKKTIQNLMFSLRNVEHLRLLNANFLNYRSENICQVRYCAFPPPQAGIFTEIY